MNAVIVGVITMLVLSMARLNVVLSLFIGAMVAGLTGGWPINDTITVFTAGLGSGAGIALSYALLGAFAAALAHSGVPAWLAAGIARRLASQPGNTLRKPRLMLLTALLAMAIASQNVIPVHIAFIPILIPPLLATCNHMQLDRRLIACVLVFGLCATYLVVPFGFGAIYLNQILAGSLAANGVMVEQALLPVAMAIPVAGMLLGLLVAGLISYRQPRRYPIVASETAASQSSAVIDKRQLRITVFALGLALLIQIITRTIMLAAVAGFSVLVISRVVAWRQADGVFIDGIKTMAFAGFVIMAASGFGEVLRQTGDLPLLISTATDLFAGHRAMAALLMLVIGLLITLGIGSSFATVPIIATVFVPLALQLHFSPLATAALVGTAGALGDAGSPASESAIGPTIGLNADGQHDHIRDTVWPTFLHYNVPMIAFGWLAAMVL